jgi:hypothetical protein
MSVVGLLEPILTVGLRNINFFNGRLLVGEDLTTEQKTNRVAHSLLGKAIGDGVVYGLEVSESAQSGTPQSPVLTVTQGLALNKLGTSLLLENDTDVALVRPATTTNGTTAIFQDCTPIQDGAYIAGAGVYLLTIGPATAPQGLAEVSGLSTSKAACNSKYNVQGVQFRLIPINLTQAELSDTNHLRNLVAYKCFGAADLSSFVSDPFGAPLTGYGLLDQLRSNQILTDCDVPLAVLYWTADSGLVFLDMWAVRRRLTHRAVDEAWPLLTGDRRVSELEAMFLQFQDQIRDLRNTQPNLASVTAAQYFSYLPPAGMLPLTGVGGSPGFTYQAFFTQQDYHDPVFISATRMEPIVRTALLYPPISLQDQGAVWLYQPVERTKTLPYLIFASIDVPFEGEARFDVALWDYANFL